MTLLEINEIRDWNRRLETCSVRPPSLPFSYKIDTFHLPYVEFETSFVLPGIPLEGPGPQVVEQVLEIAAERIPHFVSGTQLLPEARPKKDARQMHFVRHFSFQKKEYLYIFRLHLDYMGGALDSEILSPPRRGCSATFRTNRLYYEARLLPVRSVLQKQGCIVDFESEQIKETLFEVSSNEAMREIWTSVLFDEVDFSHLNQMFCGYFRFAAEWQPGRLFFPFVVDYLTLAMNFINPEQEILTKALPHFHEGYLAFLKNPRKHQPSKESELFWSEWYASFRTKPAPARSGNPHWVFTSVPR